MNHIKELFGVSKETPDIVIECSPVSAIIACITC